MPGDLQNEERSSFPVAFIIGIVVVLILVAGVVLVSRMTRSKGPAAEQHLPFGPAEQSAAARIHFTEPQMAQASNFLNQMVTYVAGTISNDGVAIVREVEVTMEFHDPFNQVILRETRKLLGPNAAPIGGGQRRDFQITLDNLPAEWNQQYPSIKIIGLQLQ